MASASITWNIKSWPPAEKCQSPPVIINGTEIKLSINPKINVNNNLTFKLTQNRNSKKSNSSNISQFNVNIGLKFSAKKYTYKIVLEQLEQEVATKISIDEFNSLYKGKQVDFTLTASLNSDSSNIPKNASNSNQTNKKSESKNTKNSLSTVSSPTRHQSVATFGRMSRSSVSSTSSNAPVNPPVNSTKNVILNSKGNGQPKVIQPKVKQGNNPAPAGSSKRPTHQNLKSTADMVSDNRSKSKNMPPSQRLPSSKKPQNSSPNASIAAKVSSNQNQNPSSVSVYEPKMPSNSSNTSPSAAIASRNSSRPPKIKGDLPHISSSSNSKPASPASKSESESNLPSIHQNPRTSHIPKNQQSGNMNPTISPTPITQPITAPASEPVSSKLRPLLAPPPESKESYAGLSNQGATCYMNSVLQSLFHIPLFRRSVFELPTEDETDKEHSIALNLQSLFCNLFQAPIDAKEQNRKEAERLEAEKKESSTEEKKDDKVKPAIDTDSLNNNNNNYSINYDYSLSAYRSSYVKPVSTKNLTKSFGWNSSEAFQQQDIQEFFRVLLNKLDDKIDEKNKKNKESNNCSGNNNNESNCNNNGTNDNEVKHVSDIFKGQTIFTISGEKVDYRSERYEDFYDLSLSVKDCSTLENSFLQFTRKEQLSDSYDTGVKGQEKIAVQIQAQIFKLPQVLTLHLQRFEYDFVHDQLTKIYDELKFPKFLDMAPYLNDNSPFKTDSGNRSQFTLTGVLIHSGDASFGHYYVYLRPKLVFSDDGTLDDSSSSFYEFNDSSVRKVKEDEAIDENFGGSDGYLNKTDFPYSNTFKRHSAYMLIYARNDCLHEIYDTNFDIPKFIKEYSKSCQRNTRSSRKTISVFDDTSIRLNTEEGKLGIYNEKAVYSIKVSADSSYEQLYKEIAKVYNVDISTIRLWKLDYMNEIESAINNTSNLSTYLPKSIYIQYKPRTEPTEVTKDQILLIIKYYTQFTDCPLLYAFSILVSRSYKVKELKKKIGERLQLPNTATIRLFEEVPYNSYTKQFIDELNDDESTIFMSKRGLRSGSSLIVQSSVRINEEIFDSIYFNSKDQENMNEQDQNYSLEAYNYVDYMVRELPESLADYIEMKRNVRRVKILDYRCYSNSNFIHLKNSKSDSINRINSVNLEEEDFYDDQNELKDYGTIEFPFSIDLDQLIDFIERMIQFDPNQSPYKIFLFRHSYKLNGPAAYPLKNISELGHKTQYLYVLFVPNDLPNDYRGKITVNIMYSEDSYNLKANLFLYAPITLKVAEIVNGLSWRKIKNRKSKPQLRAIQVKSCRIVNQLNGDEDISIFVDSVLRIEIVPENNPKLNEKTKEINVCHAIISNSIDSPFYFIGFPFLYIVDSEELFEDTKKKIAKNLKWSHEKMNHVRFYIGVDKEPFNIERVLKKGHKIFDEIDCSKGERLFMIHSSEESYRDDYSYRTSGVQIYS